VTGTLSKILMYAWRITAQNSCDLWESARKQRKRTRSTLFGEHSSMRHSTLYKSLKCIAFTCGTFGNVYTAVSCFGDFPRDLSEVCGSWKLSGSFGQSVQAFRCVSKTLKWTKYRREIFVFRLAQRYFWPICFVRIKLGCCHVLFPFSMHKFRGVCLSE